MNQKYLIKIKPITLFIFICLFISCANGQTDAEKFFYKAYECKDLDCQLNFLNKSITANPKYAPAYYGRAYIYFIQNKYIDKESDLETAIQLAPDYKDIHIAYFKASKNYPNDKYVLNILGNLWAIIGSDDEALKNFNKPIEIDSKFPQAYFSRGVQYENQSENEKALKDFAKAIESEPNFAMALFRHGALLSIVFKDFENGIPELNKAIELNPDLTAAYNSRGVAYNLNGYYEKAILDLTNSIELAPNNPEIYKYRASIYKKIGKKDLADKDEAKAKELESNKSNQ